MSATEILITTYVLEVSLGIGALYLYRSSIATSPLINVNSTVNLIFYLFSFSVCVTAIYRFLDTYLHITSQVPTLDWIAKTWLKTSLDFDVEIYVLLGVLFIVFVPQITSYLLSGLYGIAATPRLLRTTTRFVVLLTVKALAVASGILFEISVFLFQGPTSLYEMPLPGKSIPLPAIPSYFQSLLLLYFALVLTNVHLSIDEIIAAISKPPATRKLAMMRKIFAVPILRVHKWATRNLGPPTERQTISGGKLVDLAFAATTPQPEDAEGSRPRRK